MEYAQCKNGHYYDPTLYENCPTCAAEKAARRRESSLQQSGAALPEDGYGATEPVGMGERNTGFGGAFQAEDYGKTEPVGVGGFQETGYPYGGGNRGDETEPVNNGFTSGFDTTGTNGWGGGYQGGMEDSNVTEPVYQGDIHGFTPIVGWLVAIDGPARGTDYRIRPGYNFIGRDEHMDICIKGDMKISRTKAAVIGYEPEEHLFLFGPSEGKSFVKVNGKAVLGQMAIKDRDIILVGSTKLLFVPLCDERFSWDE